MSAAVAVSCHATWGTIALPLGLAATVGLSSSAWAADAASKPSEALLVGQIIVLILLGRLIGEGMMRLGQPAVMGQLIAGILLGPSVFGALWPDAQRALFSDDPAQMGMIEGIAQFGILLLLLLAGMETDLTLIRGVRRAAMSASLGGIVLPFIAGFLLGQIIPDALLPDPGRRLITSLFLGTALSIASVKIVATVVRDMGFMRRNIGQVILATAVVDDAIGWIIIAIIFGLAAQDKFDWLSTARSVLGTLVFLAASLTFGRRIVSKLIQWTNDFFHSEAPVIALIMLILGAFAVITAALGVHTVLGAFVAGILVGESPILTRQIDDQIRGLTAGLFMPVFFGLAGLSTDLRILANPELLAITGAIILISSIGKTAGAFAGGWAGGLSRRESLALACGLNAHGSTEVIVATIGLSLGALSHDLFTMIVAMALITTNLMPPTLRWALRRVPIGREEQKRLDREAFEERAFVPNIERVLVAIDASANGRFASRVAGLLAGLRGMPVTVVKVDEEPQTKAKAASSEASKDEQPDHAAETVAAAEKAVTADADAKPKIDVIERAHDASPAEAIAREARKGYDLLIIGIADVEGPKGGFSDALSEMARAFEGSLAVVVARGEHDADPAESDLNVLAPVTGNEISRRGVEFAVALAKAADATVTTLSVLDGGGGTKSRRDHARDEAAEIIKEIRSFAEHNEMPIRTVVRTDVSPVDAIVREAKRGGHDLIVLGVSRRPGERLSFGATPHALLEADRSLIFIAAQYAPPAAKPPPAEPA